MAVTVGVPKETQPGEYRVAIVPAVATRLISLGVSVLLESCAGYESHFHDSDYEGVEVVEGPEALYARSGLILKVLPPTQEEIALIPSGSTLISFLEPYQNPDHIALLRDRNITSFAVELIPRITRAQSMDALTSQAAVAGYKAALMAANLSDRFFPMLTTPAGTIRPAKVLVLGAGVAGLQAIATARRLGAVVEAYDVRRATKEQVESLGARFVEMPMDAEAAGGYARELTDEEKAQQLEILSARVADSDAVITTALIPGRPAPIIVTKEMVERMKPGSVIVDIAAETGGNCELTRAGETVLHREVVIHGPVDVPSLLPVHASEMYSRNLFNLLQLMIKEGEFAPDWQDQIVAESVLTHGGEIKNQRSRELVERQAA